MACMDPTTSTLSIISQKTLAVPQLQTGKCGSAAQIWRAVAIASRLRTFATLAFQTPEFVTRWGRFIADGGATRTRARSYTLGCALGFFAPLVAFALIGIEQLLA